MPRVKGKDKSLEYFPVLKLPAEIRNRIWKCAVVVSKIVELRAPKQHHASSLLPARSRRGIWRYPPFSLASVSRQLYEEVVPIYYTHNTFGVLFAPRQMYGPDITRFLAGLRPKNQLCITSLSLYILFPAHIHWHDLEWRVFRKLPRLRKLEFNVPSLEAHRLHKARLQRICGDRLNPSFSFRSYGARRAPIFSSDSEDDINTSFIRNT